jgi:hypothetical protein
MEGTENAAQTPASQPEASKTVGSFPIKPVKKVNFEKISDKGWELGYSKEPMLNTK